MASLNEFRESFGLKRHETMEDLNPDPEIADLLRKLYTHPDMVELYPGLFLEEGKPRMDPGCGGCPPYTVGRAVFSDAITLVRSDRFYTIVRYLTQKLATTCFLIMKLGLHSRFIDELGNSRGPARL
jgi:hypothetical protein